MPSRDSARALLLVKRASPHLRIESTEANEVNKENPSGHAIRESRIASNPESEFLLCEACVLGGDDGQ